MRVVLILVALVALCVASPGQPSVVLERSNLSQPPLGWTRLARAPTTSPLTVTLVLKQRKVEELEAVVRRVSDPDHEEYGRHWSMEAINRLVAPEAEDVRRVVQWLQDSHIQRYEVFSDFIRVHASVGLVEKLLQTQYYSYHHSSSNQTLYRTSSYSIPSTLSGVVDFVSPTVRFPVPSRIHAIPSILRADQEPNTPDRLRKLYQMDSIKNQHPKNRQAVASFLEQYYSSEDLQTFFKMYQPDSVGRKPDQIGPNDEELTGLEAQLDVQFLMGVGKHVPTTVHYTVGVAPDNSMNEPFLDWLLNISATASVPYVYSVSYAEDEKSVSLPYATRVNNELMKLGARGMTVFVAAGDSGVGGNCTSTNRFTPYFPSASPWVTAVGGLVGGNPGQVPTGETVDVIGGGGFSDIWPRPYYQDVAVPNFFKTSSNLPNPKFYNASGRGYPDISAQSQAFTVVNWGNSMLVGGTSAATPTVAAVFALLNDVRLSLGKTPLGFINPLLYQVFSQTPNTFNDAVEGYNRGCFDDKGFFATSGWDAASGWGSPNYAIMAKLVAKLK